MLNICVLVSGGGTNLQALIDAQDNKILQSGRLVHVISSNKDAYAITRALKAGIPVSVIEYDKNFEASVLEALREYKPDIIVLAGFMHILSKSFIDNCNAKIINVHPSLIPSFCGKGFYGLRVHEAVLNSGVKLTGATVHLVNEIPDGGEILSQKAVEILPDDTPQRLQRRVMEQAEWIILPRAVEDMCTKLEPKIFPYPIKYPGRGIITGYTTSGKIMLAYFIMGRSKSSKARIFERLGDELIIRLTEHDKNFDSTLILYSPIRIHGENVIVTNGDQTDTVYEYLKAGKTFEQALRTREYEPDAPHYTPRISALINKAGYRQSILKRSGKFFYEYDRTEGLGHMIHTYDHDVMPCAALPSFMGEPREIHIPAINTAEEFNSFASLLWDALDEDYRVALYVRCYDAEFTSYNDKLFNATEM